MKTHVGRSKRISIFGTLIRETFFYHQITYTLLLSRERERQQKNEGSNVGILDWIGVSSWINCYICIYDTYVFKKIRTFEESHLILVPYKLIFV